MAQSRLERIGTIYTRITQLMKGGGMKIEDQPMWYVIYKAFPPKLEPRFDRVAPNIEIRDIFYKDDIFRAQFHRDYHKSLIADFSKENLQSYSQKFVTICLDLEKNGMAESEIYEKAIDLFKEQNPNFRGFRKEKLSSSQFAQAPSAGKINEPKESKVNLAEILKE